MKLIDFIVENLFNLWMYFDLITLLFSLLIIISGNRIFKETGYSSSKSLYPIYNLIIMLDIVKLSKIAFILLLIPVINIIIIIIILYRLSIIYRVDKSFAVGLLLFPIVFLPLLNYGKKYNLPEKDKDDVSGEMMTILTEEQLKSLNTTDEEEKKVDNVFKANINEQPNEPVPTFKAYNTVKYREMMLDDDDVDKIRETVSPVKVEDKISEHKYASKTEEDDSIEIVEL